MFSLITPLLISAAKLSGVLRFQERPAKICSNVADVVAGDSRYR
jgi:hypothetical protein